MEPSQYGSAFRRRWWVVPLTVAVAFGVGWFTTSPTVASNVKPGTAYKATTIMDVGSSNQARLALLLTITPVASRAAKILHYQGHPLDLVNRVTSSQNPDAEVLYIGSTATDPKQAVANAQAFAKALIGYSRQQRQASLTAQIARLRTSIADALKIGDTATVVNLRFQVAQALATETQPIGLSVLEPAHPVQIATGGFHAPRSRTIRLLIAAALGLLAGLALVLLSERFDSRIRTRETAGERFGYPVVGEIPVMSRKKRKGIVTVRYPTSAAADAFRLLGASVGVATPESTSESGHHRGRTVLVTSPGPSEGKTTTVVNLAAALAEEGARLVVVISADLRKSTIETRLNAVRSPGLSDAAREPNEPKLFPYQQPTSIDCASLVASGAPTSRPGEVLASANVRSLIEQARAISDWVLIDTSPILTATESALLVEEADLVLMVSRSGRTSSRLAARTHETLETLGAAEVRVVINGAKEVVMPSGYRRYYRSSDRRIFARSRKG